MDIFGSIGTIMSLGSFAINLFANNRKRQLYQQQQGYYEWEAEINRRIGQLNAQAAEYSGKQAVSAIAAQTKKILGKQLVEFSNRGIELEGSPSFVMGETETMGSREAQNAYFNAQVEKLNYQYRAKAAAMGAQNRADEAKYGSYASMIDSIKGMKDGFQLMNSMFTCLGAPRLIQVLRDLLIQQFTIPQIQEQAVTLRLIQLSYPE